MNIRCWFAACLVAFLAAPLSSRANPATDQNTGWPGQAKVARRATKRLNPAQITDLSRHPLDVDDFLRLSYVPTDTPPITTPGSPSRKRAFFADTQFYEPPITVSQIVGYAGGETNAVQDLIAMRCRPGDAAAVATDPQLATWASLARFLLADLPPATCPATPGASTPATAYCLAKGFHDTANTPLVESLYNAISLGQALFEIPADESGQTGADLLATLYGIFPGHSGIGFVVKDSATGAFTAEQTLINSVVPEYLLKNVSLAAGDCRCVRVPPYLDRDNQLLSPRFVWSFGPLTSGGACRMVRQIMRE